MTASHAANLTSVHRQALNLLTHPAHTKLLPCTSAAAIHDTNSARSRWRHNGDKLLWYTPLLALPREAKPLLQHTF